MARSGRATSRAMTSSESHVGPAIVARVDSRGSCRSRGVHEIALCEHERMHAFRHDIRVRAVDTIVDVIPAPVRPIGDADHTRDEGHGLCDHDPTGFRDDVDVVGPRREQRPQCVGDRLQRRNELIVGGGESAADVEHVEAHRQRRLQTIHQGERRGRSLREPSGIIELTTHVEAETTHSDAPVQRRTDKCLRSIRRYTELARQIDARVRTAIGKANEHPRIEPDELVEFAHVVDHEGGHSRGAGGGDFSGFLDGMGVQDAVTGHAMTTNERELLGRGDIECSPVLCDRGDDGWVVEGFDRVVEPDERQRRAEATMLSADAFDIEEEERSAVLGESCARARQSEQLGHLLTSHVVEGKGTVVHRGSPFGVRRPTLAVSVNDAPAIA